MSLFSTFWVLLQVQIHFEGNHFGIWEEKHKNDFKLLIFISLFFKWSSLFWKFCKTYFLFTFCEKFKINRFSTLWCFNPTIILTFICMLGNWAFCWLDFGIQSFVQSRPFLFVQNKSFNLLSISLKTRDLYLSHVCCSPLKNSLVKTRNGFKIYDLNPYQNQNFQHLFWRTIWLALQLQYFLH
jgi:hypothetical protein